jgi:hypothetical protein
MKVLAKHPIQPFYHLITTVLLSLLSDASARIYRPSIHENKPKTLVSVIENERYGRVFAKTGSIISGTGPPYPNPRFGCVRTKLFKYLKLFILPGLAQYTLLVITLLYISFGAAGYLSYGPNTQEGLHFNKQFV